MTKRSKPCAKVLTKAPSLDRASIVKALRYAYELETKGHANPTPFDEEAAWHEIERAVVSVLREVADDEAAIDGAARTEHYWQFTRKLNSVCDQLRCTLETPKLTDPFMWAWGEAINADPNYYDSQQVEQELRKIQHQLNTLAQWSALAHREAAGTVVASRPSRRTLRARLIWAMAFIYKKHSGRDPARSYDAIENSYDGPFVRFVAAVADGMKLNLTEAKMASAISKEKKDPEWFRVCQPPPDPTKSFRDLIGYSLERAGSSSNGP